MQRKRAWILSIFLLAFAGIMASIYEPKRSAPPPQEIPGDSLPLKHSSKAPPVEISPASLVQELVHSNLTLSTPAAMLTNAPPSPSTTNLTIVVPPPVNPPGLPAPSSPPVAPPAPPKPEAPVQLPIYASGTTTNKDIAITFDDGPHPTLTYKALDELRARNIKATFFVLGNRVKQYPWILQQTAAEGHDIGNHSWSHPILSSLNDESAEREIKDTQEEIKQVLGKEPYLFRPPYMILPRNKKIITENHLSIILWSVDPRDWQVRNAEKVFNAVTNYARPGSIILLHDIHATTLQALPRILDALTEQGYHFKTVSELCGISPPPPPITPQASTTPSSP